MTRRCHAFGVAVRTAQRCLGHYTVDYGPDRVGFDAEFISKKKNRALFWGGNAFERKKQNRTKINRALFFVPLGGSGSRLVSQKKHGVSFDPEPTLRPTTPPEVPWEDEICFRHIFLAACRKKTTLVSRISGLND